VRNILSTQAWLRLLRADFDVANLLRVVAVRLVRRTLAAMDPIVNLVPGGITRVGAVRRGMRALAQRGVPILYVLGRNDPGVEELAEYFGRDGRRLRRLPNVTLDTLTGADHTLGTHALRATLIDLVCQWCRNGWPIRGSVPQRGAADPAPSQRASTQVLPAE
jgi:pimeloyl-ACP methyl ester carboxylesterase